MKPIVSDSAIVSPQFYDLDPMNIVWHGNYPKFFEIGRNALLKKIGYGYDEMIASGYAWPVIDMGIRYYRPLTLARPVEITAGVTEWENRLRIQYTLRDVATGKRTTTGHTLQVAVEIKTEKMLWETPPILRQVLSPYLRAEG
ncbi:MAG TPA: thioesterase family protein [Rhizomicrobium sp.]|jgi:acyl-CoA thioester hydrolase|nr:thioesterase family protein [Rhizomicrobium sp.]